MARLLQFREKGFSRSETWTNIMKAIGKLRLKTGKTDENLTTLLFKSHALSSPDLIEKFFPTLLENKQKFSTI